VQTLPFCTVAFDGCIVAEAGHGMTPFFVFNTLPFGVFVAAEFEFLLDTS
jgi:hypothetical protein